MTKMWTMRSDHRGVWKKVTLVWCRTDICRKLSGRRRQGRAAHRIALRGPSPRGCWIAATAKVTGDDTTLAGAQAQHADLAPGPAATWPARPGDGICASKNDAGLPGSGGRGTPNKYALGSSTSHRDPPTEAHSDADDARNSQGPKVAYLRDETTSSFRFQTRQAARAGNNSGYLTSRDIRARSGTILHDTPVT